MYQRPGRDEVMYSREVIDEVISRNDIVDVISGYVKLKKNGSSYTGLCPFHNEKSPSFSVSGQRQLYHCFGCGAGGNVITFVMEYENMTFLEAVKMLGERAGVALPQTSMSEEDRKERGIRDRLLEINKIAATYYYRQLRSENGKAGLDYLKKRELSDSTINSFGLGYATQSTGNLYKLLKDKGYDDDILKESGLFTYERGIHEKFWNRVIFPIMDINNKVIGFGGRVMGDAKPKYLNSPETRLFDKSRNLYGLNIARTSRKPNMIICEGYMDVISLHQAGFTNAVASLGTALTAGHAALIKRYVNEVYLTYDSDEAGTKAALRAAPILREAGVTTRVIRMEPYKDPDEFIKNLGAEAFEERIRKARNSFMFGLEMLEKGYDLNAPEGKTEFLREAARRLARFEEEIERDNYIEAVAKTYHVGYEELKKLVVKVAVQSGMAAPATKPRQTIRQETPKEDGHIRSQKILLTWLIDREELFDQVSRYVTPEDFTVELYRKVAELLYEQHAKGELNPAQIMNYFTEEEEHRAVAALFNTRIKELTTAGEQEKAIKETILRVKEYSIETATRNLDPTDIQGLQRLMNAKKAVQDLHKLHISIN